MGKRMEVIFESGCLIFLCVSINILATRTALQVYNMKTRFSNEMHYIFFLLTQITLNRLGGL